MVRLRTTYRHPRSMYGRPPDHKSWWWWWWSSISTTSLTSLHASIMNHEWSMTKTYVSEAINEKIHHQVKTEHRSSSETALIVASQRQHKRQAIHSRWSGTSPASLGSTWHLVLGTWVNHSEPKLRLQAVGIAVHCSFNQPRSSSRRSPSSPWPHCSTACAIWNIIHHQSSSISICFPFPRRRRGRLPYWLHL